MTKISPELKFKFEKNFTKISPKLKGFFKYPKKCPYSIWSEWLVQCVHISAKQIPKFMTDYGISL